MRNSPRRPSSPHYPRLRRLFKRLFILCIVVIVVSILAPLSLRWIDPPGSAFIVQRSWQMRHDDSFSVQHSWVDLAEISPWLPLAVIAAEDQRFGLHNGFDFDSIEKAWRDQQSGRRARGASTLSQQLAKNLFLWPGRSWLRKGLEVWFTSWLEVCLSKQRILELYLNLAEFGDGVYGAEAAARHHFGRSATSLNARQGALLASVLPSPRRYRIHPPSDFISQRVEWILQQGRQLGGPELVENL